ncbi:MAG: hypothetical protein WCB74_00275, partial [Pseudolabrys sp.]
MRRGARHLAPSLFQRQYTGELDQGLTIYAIFIAKPWALVFPVIGAIALAGIAVIADMSFNIQTKRGRLL